MGRSTRTILGVIDLIRPGNCLIIGFAALVGYTIGGGSDPLKASLLFLGAAMLGAWGNIINDFFDLEVDKVNKPWRPLAKGIITPRQGLTLGLLLASLGIALSIYVSLVCGVLAVASFLLLFIYSWRAKSSGLPGNILVSLLSALNILYGGVASPKPQLSILPSIYAFTIILGRELAKSLEDIKGDAEAGIKTIAVQHGPRTAMQASGAVLLALVAISPLPALFLGYSTRYLALALLGVDLPILYSLRLLWRNPVANAWRATRILKIPLFMGLLAFLLG